MKKLLSLLVALAMLLTASASFAEDTAAETPENYKIQFSMKAGDLSSLPIDEATEKGIRAFIDALSITFTTDADSILLKSTLNNKDFFTAQADKTADGIALTSNAISNTAFVFDASAASSIADETALENALSKFNGVLEILNPYFEDLHAWVAANQSLVKTEEGTFEYPSYDTGVKKLTAELPAVKVCELMQTLVKRASADEKLNALLVSAASFTGINSAEEYNSKMAEYEAYWNSEETLAKFAFTENMTVIVGDSVSYISIDVDETNILRFTKKTEGDNVKYALRFVANGFGFIYDVAVNAPAVDADGASTVTLTAVEAVGSFDENDKLVSGTRSETQVTAIVNTEALTALVTGEETEYSVNNGAEQKMLSMPLYISATDKSLDMSLGIKIGDSTETALSLLLSAAPTDETIKNADISDMKQIKITQEMDEETQTALATSIQVGAMRVVANLMAAMPEDTATLITNLMTNLMSMSPSSSMTTTSPSSVQVQ